jgi:3-methyladenine DNA glycosylase AlkD
MNYKTLQLEIKKKSSQERAKRTMSFFKTGEGQYSEGDIFIGVSNPDLRDIAKNYPQTSKKDLVKLLQSPIHEERLLSLILMVNQFRRGGKLIRAEIFNIYTNHKAFVNNWDLVDLSSPVLLGDFCLENNYYAFMEDLLTSKRHWDRRMAIVGTLSFIRTGLTKLTFIYAQKLLGDKEDLMHKATGWMLREAGKRDEKSLRKFLSLNGKKMPRTMLRYAIEKFSEKERKKILVSTRS